MSMSGTYASLTDVSHGSGAKSTTSGIVQLPAVCRVAFDVRNPGTVQQQNLFLDTVKDHFQETGAWPIAIGDIICPTVESIEREFPELKESALVAKYNEMLTAYQLLNTGIFNYIHPALKHSNASYTWMDTEKVNTFKDPDSKLRDGRSLYAWIYSFIDPKRPAAQGDAKKKCWNFVIEEATGLEEFRLKVHNIWHVFKSITENDVTKRKVIALFYDMLLGKHTGTDHFNEKGCAPSGFPVSPVGGPLVLTRLWLITKLKSFKHPDYECDECADVPQLLEQLVNYAQESGLRNNKTSSGVGGQPAIMSLQLNADAAAAANAGPGADTAPKKKRNVLSAAASFNNWMQMGNYMLRLLLAVPLLYRLHQIELARQLA